MCGVKGWAKAGARARKTSSAANAPPGQTRDLKSEARNPKPERNPKSESAKFVAH
jgi:hypothetical protein